MERESLRSGHGCFFHLISVSKLRESKRACEHDCRSTPVFVRSAMRTAVWLTLKGLLKFPGKTAGASLRAKASAASVA